MGSSERARLSGGTVAWQRAGQGPPIVLVHGTPSWSYAWRGVAAELEPSFTVYRWDLLGYGDSEQAAGQDVSIAAQARYLVELLDLWDLGGPMVVGHDIGGAIVLRAHLCEGRPFAAISLVDAVVFNPWSTPTTMHIRRHLDAYRSMPAHIYQEVVRAHLRTATASDPGPEVLAAYLRPWLGPAGQQAYLRKLEQIDEARPASWSRSSARWRRPFRWCGASGTPGSTRRWRRRLAEAIPGARLDLVPGAGHFVMEDDPQAVAALLRGHAELVSERV